MKTATSDNTNAGHTASGTPTKFPVWKILIVTLCVAHFISPRIFGQNTHRVAFSRSAGQSFSAPDSASLSITNAITIEAWVKIDAVDGTDQAIVGKGRSSNGTGYALLVSAANKFNLSIWTGTATSVSSAMTPQADTWYHVAGTWDGSTAKIYINGNLDNSAVIPGSMSDSAEPLYIGRELTAAPERYFGGSIDDVRVWATARPEAQIRTNIFQELQGTETGLRGYWKLNFSSLDATGNGNTLTNNNAPVFRSNDMPFFSSGQQLEFCADKDAELLLHLNGSSGDTSARHSQTDTAVQYSAGAGRFEQGGLFNGSSSVIDIGTNFAAQNQQTVVAWVRPATTVGVRPVIEKAIEGYGGEIDNELFILDGGRAHWAIVTDNGSTGIFSIAEGSTLLPTNAWTCLVGVVDQKRDEMRLYVNGIKESTASMGGRNAKNGNRPMRIGKRVGNQAVHYFAGSIDEAAVFNRAFSDEEVMKYYGGIVSARFVSASGTNSPVDGLVQRGDATDKSWADVHDGVGNQGSAITTQHSVLVKSGNLPGAWWDLSKGIHVFDTSALPDASITLNHAALTCYAESKSNSLGTTASHSRIHVVTANPVSSGNINPGTDYQSLASASLGSREFADLAPLVFNSHEFSSTGLTAINTSGFTKLGLRLGCDLLNEAPNWGGPGLFLHYTYASTDSNVNRPFLLIEYTSVFGANSISGNISAISLPAGTIRVTATSTSTGANGTVMFTGPGFYTIPNLLSGQSYNISAYLDVNNDGVHQPWEPEGSYAGNPLALTGNATGVNFALVIPPDTDHDGMSDTWELANGLTVGTNDALLDKDGDGLLNIQEYYLETNTGSPDTDGDNLPDGVEYNAGMNPRSSDTDGDGLPDKWEMDNGLNPLANDAALDADGDGLTNAQEYNGGVNGTNPRSIDSNGNGVSDYEEQNGVRLISHSYDKLDRLISTQYANGAWEAWRYDGNGNILAHSLKTLRDADGDGLPDAWEFANGLAINNGSGSQGFSGDGDGDNWTNYQEFLTGTSPTDATSHPPVGGQAGAAWFNPPRARIVFPPASGGIYPHISLKLWDADGNPAQTRFQWFDAVAQQWKYPTIAQVDGSIFFLDKLLETSPSGTTHDVVWLTPNDFSNFNGIVLLRAIVQDAAGTTTSEVAPFAVNTTGDFDGDGLPDAWEAPRNLDPNDATGDNGAFGNPDGDGFTNFAEFAFGLNPQTSDTVGVPTVTAEVKPADGKTYLTVTYRRRTDAVNLIYEIQTTADLVIWTTSGADVEPISIAPGGINLEVVKVRIQPSFDSLGTPVKFVRVRVRTQ